MMVTQRVVRVTAVDGNVVDQTKAVSVNFQKKRAR